MTSPNRPMRPILAVALLAATVMAGCGDSKNPGPDVDVYEVEGQVVLTGGEPLTAGQVVFVPVDPALPMAYGQLGPDGHFRMTTANPGDGAAEGEFKVRIDPDYDNLPTPKARGSKPKPPFPAKYSDPDKSGLVVRVKPESQDLEPFRLK